MSRNEKELFVKRLLLIIILTFSLPSWAIAGDIRDFEIEGISIGNSALKYFTKDLIKKNSFDYYNDKTFTPVQMPTLPFYEQYDYVDFDFKTNDKKYIIHALYGVINYEKNINDCYNQMDEIVDSMMILFDNVEVNEKYDEMRPELTGDPSGKSKATIVNFWFYNDDRASVTCYDYSKQHGGGDNLSVGIQTKEQNEFLFNKAYR